MSYDEKAPKIPRLTGPLNYRTWAEEVRSFLESRGLLDLVLGDEPRPDDTPTTSSSRHIASVRARGGMRPQPRSADIEEGTGVPGVSLHEAWRRKNARARTCIMSYCSLTMKNKIIDLPTANEQWEALRKDCRPSNDISLATYTSQFYSYEPKQGATVDSISNDLRDLQAYIFATDPDEAPTEKSKISALLRAVRKLGTEYSTRIEILEDKISTLDYDSVVISLKETEQRLKLRATKDATNATDEQALAANDRPNKRPKRSEKGPGWNQNGRNQNSQYQGRQTGQKRKRTCWCCGDEGHIKFDCSIWLQTIDGKEHAKRQKTSSTGRLPTPGTS